MVFLSPSDGAPISPYHQLFGTPGQTKVKCDRQRQTTHNFCCLAAKFKSLRAAEKSQGAAEKNKETVETNCNGFSAEFFGSQSVEMFCFACFERFSKIPKDHKDSHKLKSS